MTDEEYRNLYYGYDFEEVEIPEHSGGGGGGDGVTREEMQQAIDSAINDALGKISIQQVDDDTVSLDIDGQNAGNINDVYLTGVEREDSEIRFKMNNGKDDIVVDVDKFDNPNIDCETF